MKRLALENLLRPRTDGGSVTRMVAMGSRALTEGFALIGFETLPDTTPEELEEVLGTFLKQRQKALLLLEDTLVRDPGPMVNRARMESAHIVMVEIPRLEEPADYHPQVEAMVLSILGANALEEVQ